MLDANTLSCAKWQQQATILPSTRISDYDGSAKLTTLSFLTSSSSPNSNLLLQGSVTPSLHSVGELLMKCLLL